eukprot:g10146.t1
MGPALLWTTRGDSCIYCTLTELSLQAPDLGGINGLLKYLTKIVALAPEQKDEDGMPKGVLLLGGTFVVRNSEA